MPEPSENARLVAASLIKPRDLPEAIAQARERIGVGEGESVLLAMIDLKCQSTHGNADAIVAVMSALEGIAPVDPVVAAYFMAKLYPLASDAFLHEVCDAIELWTDSLKSLPTTGLGSFAATGANHEAWATTLEQLIKADGV